jgi:hypothetical protein
MAPGPPGPYVGDMTYQPTALERAFELARSGKYQGTSEIRAQLKAEGFNANQLEGPSLLRQLREICTAAREAGNE